MTPIRLSGLLAAALFGGSATALACAAISPERFGPALTATSAVMVIASVVVMLQYWLLMYQFRQAREMQHLVAQRHGSTRTGDVDAELPPRCRECDQGVIGYTGIYRISDHGQVSLEETNQPCGCRVHRLRFLGAITAPRP